MSRFIGIRHRRKRSASGVAKPTCVAIVDNGNTATLDLENDTAELDFVLHRLPVKWRKLEVDEELELFDANDCPQGHFHHHCKWRKVKKDESVSDINETLLTRNSKGELIVCTHVPTDFEGLKAGDIVAMILGGSGDRFAAALSRQGEEVDAEVYRIPPYVISSRRGQGQKDDDNLLLAELVVTEPDLFYRVRLRDRDSIRIKEALSVRMDALKTLIACGQRIMQRLSGHIFLSEEGLYPEGVIEDQYDQAKASDAIYQGMEEELKRCNKELERWVKAAPIWERVFASIEGCGPRLAAGLIAPIADVRRFWVEPDVNEMERLKQAIADCKILGQFEADKDNVRGQITPGMSDYDQLTLVAAWQRQNSKEDKAEFLERAKEYHRQRSRLRQKARNKGRSKLKAFCGVHVITFDAEGNDIPPDQQFPRRRRGKTSNWNPVARQALYLLAEQFNRRPQSRWGQKLLENKKSQRQLYPDVIEEQVTVTNNGKKETKTVKRFTDGHILKRAQWRTLSQFVCHLFDEWTKCELEAARSDS